MSVMAPDGSGQPPGAGKRAGFPRARRLLRHAEFERVYTQGRRHFAAHMTVFYWRRPDTGGLRVGFTVSKALGGAVQRNRMRRRLREAVRLEGLAAASPVDVVINPKKSLLKADFAELRGQVRRAFEVIGQNVKDKRQSEKTP